MKKILLATTILGMTAGFAAAEVKISGSASMGIARDGSAGTHDGTVYGVYEDQNFHAYNSGEINFGATVVSDAGVEFGMSTSVSFGNAYGFADDDGFTGNGGTVDAPTLTAKGAFGTLTFSDNGIDMLYSDLTAGDVSYAYSAGDLSVTVVSDVDGVDSDSAENDMDWSANVGYTMSGVALSLTTDANSSYNASVSYTSGSITGTIESDLDNSEDGNSAVTTVTLGYAANGISVEVSGDSADEQSTSVSVGYSANGMSVDYSTDQDSNWEANASYDLGGGASLVAGMNYSEDAFAGINLSF